MIDDGTNDHNDYHCDDDYRQCVNMAEKRPFLVCKKTNINVRRWPRWERPSSLLPVLHRHDHDDDLHPHDDDDDDDVLQPDDDHVDCDYGDPEEDRDDKCFTLILPFVFLTTHNPDGINVAQNNVLGIIIVARKDCGVTSNIMPVFFSFGYIYF